MKIYLDLILGLNFCFDFLLLMTINIILKRAISIKKITLAALVGSLSILALFIKLNSLTLLIFKILISIIMLFIAFGYKNRKYFLINFIYLYITSFILGGFLYFINLEFSYKNIGLVFFNNGFSINVIVLLILSPIILYIYIKQSQFYKYNASKYHEASFYYKNKLYKFNAYLDTGNRLTDPYKNRPINILYSNKIKLNLEDSLLVPYKTINGNNIMKCFIVPKLIIDKHKVITNSLIGLSNISFKIDGIDFILNNEMENFL